jgi:RND superfamily putative drug exporter
VCYIVTALQSGRYLNRLAAWAVLIVGLGLLGVCGPLAGKLAGHEDNSPTTFLPTGAPATRVLAFEEAHPVLGGAPAVVVFASRGGPLAAGLAVVAARFEESVHAARLPQASEPSPPQISRNGRVAFVVVPLAADISSGTLSHDVSMLARMAEAAVRSSGLRGISDAVGGPAGSAADVSQAFAGVDGRLLGITVSIVVLLLLFTYRSPLLWLLPLLSVLVAAGWSEGAAYLLATNGFVVNGMTVGILTVVVFGAGTDYALLIMARVREEMVHCEDHRMAVGRALTRTAPTILASGGSVILALMCLLLARLRDVAALGPACAAGVACALVAQLAILPALLVICGRGVFWPRIPRPGAASGLANPRWARLAELVISRKAMLGVPVGVVLVISCLGVLAYRGGVNQQNGFRARVGAVIAQDLLSEGFPAGSSAPVTVLVRPQSRLGKAEAVVRSTPGVVAVSPPIRVDGSAVLDVSLAYSPSSPSAERSVALLQEHLTKAAGPQSLVGGETATDLDLHQAAVADTERILPAVLAVVLLVLGVLLRALVAPLVLTASVLATYGAALGVSTLVILHIFGFPGFDPTVPIFGFVFLVALGVDYTVFLASRAREETVRLGGTRAGMARSLEATGPVITAAGLVLAATFAALAVLPLVALTEVGFLVAFGVLLDTFLVRSILVPALAASLGESFWWPSRPGGGPSLE